MRSHTQGATSELEWVDRLSKQIEEAESRTNKHQRMEPDEPDAKEFAFGAPRDHVFQLVEISARGFNPTRLLLGSLS